MAKDTGALSTLKVKPVYGVPVEEDDDVDQAMQRVMGAYSARQQRNYDPYLMAIGQGLLSSKGNFGEAVGMASKNYEDTRARLGQEEIDTAAANLQLAQSRREQALMRQKTAGLAEMLPTSGSATENLSVDPDAMKQLVMTGVDPEVAMQILSSSANASGKRPLITPEAIFKYVSTFGSDANSDTAVKLLLAQDAAYEVKDGVLYNKRDGTAVRLIPIGLPAAGEDPKLTATIGGDILMDSRARLLYNNAASKGEASANKFVEDFKKFGVAPDWAEKAYNTGPVRPEVDSGQLSVALQTLAGKTNSFKNLSPEELKKIRLTPAEAKIFGALNRITAAQGNVENLSAYDKQVLSVAQGLMTKPAISLDSATETPAPKAVAPVAPAPVAAPAAAAPAAALAAASTPAPALAAPAASVAAPAVKATAPAVDGLPSMPALKPYPAPPTGVVSTQQQTAYNNSVKAIEEENRAIIKNFELQYGTAAADRARGLQADADVQKAGKEALAKKAAAEEAAVTDNLKNAKAMLFGAGRIAQKVMSSPQAYGLLEHPGYVYAILTLADEGVKVGDKSITIAGLKSALLKADPSITQDDLNNRASAAKDLAELQLQYAKKDMKGQGAISDKERALAALLAGSPDDNYLVLYHRMKLLAERSQRDIDEANAFQRWRNDSKNDNKNFYDFQRTSAELAGINAKYDKKMEDLSNKWFKTGASTKAEAPANVPPRFTKAQQAIADALK